MGATWVANPKLPRTKGKRPSVASRRCGFYLQLDVRLWAFLVNSGRRSWSNPMVPFWGRYTTHFSRDFSGDWDVHWGYDLDFDPWPC